LLADFRDLSTLDERWGDLVTGMAASGIPTSVEELDKLPLTVDVRGGA
jgi:hypothetical protein